MVPFIPIAEIIGRIAAGGLVRSGGAILEAGTGSIHGFLKNVGSFVGIVEPALSGDQFGEIKDALEKLCLINAVGSIPSVATLGISVAGFWVVSNKLNRFDAKLDALMGSAESIQEAIRGMNLKYETFSFARIAVAAEQLNAAQQASTTLKKNNLLCSSSNVFAEYRHYYYEMIKNCGCWVNGEIPINSAIEIYSRFIVCCLGQLYSEFLFGDISCFKEVWRKINQQVSEISNFDKKIALRARANRITSNSGPLKVPDYQQIAGQLKEAKEVTSETCARVEAMLIEAEFLEKEGLEPIHYIKKLKSFQPGIILIPFTGSTSTIGLATK